MFKNGLNVDHGLVIRRRWAVQTWIRGRRRVIGAGRFRIRRGLDLRQARVGFMIGPAK